MLSLKPMMFAGVLVLGFFMETGRADAVYEQVPQGEVFWYDLVLPDAYGLLNKAQTDLRMMIQRTGDSITTVAFAGGGIALRFWETRGYNYTFTGEKITGSQLIWDAAKHDFAVKHPLILDLTISGTSVHGTFIMKRSEAYRRKMNYPENPGLKDFSGSVTGRVVTEDELKQLNAVSTDAEWTCWMGPNQNFSATSMPDVEIVEDLSQSRLLWRSPFIGPPEHGGCRYKPQWFTPPAGGGASPLVYNSRLYQFHFVPSGDSWIWCDSQEIFVDTPSLFLPYIERMELTEKEVQDPSRIDADEYMSCIDAATGRLLWRTKFPGEGYNLNYHKGALTNNTGCIGDGRVYVFGALGIIRCLDAETGEQIWAKNAPGLYEQMYQCREEAHATRETRDPPCGGRSNCNALNYIGGRVIVPTAYASSGLSGLDGATGDVVWTVTENILTQKANALRWAHQGKEYVIAVSDENGESGATITCIDPADGRIVWQQNGAGSSTYQFVLHEDFLVTADGCYRLSLTGADKIWASPCVPNAKAIAVIANDIAWFPCNHDGYVVGIDLASGAEVARTDFEGERPDEGAMWAGYGRVIIDPSTQHNTTQYNMFPDSPENFAEMGSEWRPPHIHATTYSTPMQHALVDGRFYIRGLDGIYCYDLRKESSSRHRELKGPEAHKLPAGNLRMNHKGLWVGEMSANYTVRIYNTSGQLLSSFTKRAGASAYHPAQFKSGVYLATISGDGSVRRASIVLR